jgi:hypothetical protein
MYTFITYLLNTYYCVVHIICFFYAFIFNFKYNLHYILQFTYYNLQALISRRANACSCCLIRVALLCFALHPQPYICMFLS